MNYFKKKAAVTKYLPLISEGKTEQEIKDAIGADDKVYTSAEVDEIYQALINPAAAKPKVKVNFGVYIPEQGKEFTKADIEGNSDIIDYLIDIKSGAITVLEDTL
jgi:hypothetical protein